MKFAVACTSHSIDYTGLDDTSLEIIEADCPKDAAFKAILPNLLEMDNDIASDIRSGNEESGNVGLTPEVCFLTKQGFEKARTEYWKKHAKLKKDKYERSWDFYLDMVDEFDMVWGFKVKLIK